MREKTFEQAKNYAMNLISYRPRSERELRQKLEQHAYPDEFIERLVSELKAEGFVDDATFAKLWTGMRSKASAKSVSFIKAELYSKGLDRDTVKHAMSELKRDYNEEAAVRELAKRRSKALKGLDKKKAKQRLFSYLKRRGFSSDVIFKVLGQG